MWAWRDSISMIGDYCKRLTRVKCRHGNVITFESSTFELFLISQSHHLSLKWRKRRNLRIEIFFPVSSTQNNPGSEIKTFVDYILVADWFSSIQPIREKIKCLPVRHVTVTKSQLRALGEGVVLHEIFGGAIATRFSNP